MLAKRSQGMLASTCKLLSSSFYQKKSNITVPHLVADHFVTGISSGRSHIYKRLGANKKSMRLLVSGKSTQKNLFEVLKSYVLISILNFNLFI